MYQKKDDSAELLMCLAPLSFNVTFRLNLRRFLLEVIATEESLTVLSRKEGMLSDGLSGWIFDFDNWNMGPVRMLQKWVCDGTVK